ncbi:hypothetical protein X770_03990 [Mesorhizobium sp. LSJC269B00]|nr:hypothetical protein X770_03990 [Mesorhizobium sp. LSJC269B00]
METTEKTRQINDMATHGRSFRANSKYRRSGFSRHLWKTTALSTLALALSGIAAHAGDTGLWQPQVRAIIGANNNGGNTAIEGFLPLKQNLESVLFLDVRSKYDFDDGFGQDVGLGVRRIVNPDLMIGGYAYLNIQNHDSHQFVASTLGLEAITSKYDAHVNVYLPISGDRSTAGQESSLSLVGHQLIEQISAIAHRDYAAWGIEGEVGVQVPLNLPENHSLRFDVGAYHFGDPDGDDGSITGAKAGLEYSIGDVIGKGTSLTFTGEVRNDNRDDTQFAGSIRLTVPLNAFDKGWSSADDGAEPVYPVSPGLRKRVNERVRGDIGVRIESQDKVTGTSTRVAINAATNTAFGQFFFADGDNDALGLGTIGDPTTLDNAVAGAGANGVVVALGGKGNITTAGVTLANGQTVIGGGGGVQARLADGSIGTYNFGGSNGTIQGTNPANNVLTLANGNTLSGITITGGKDGIFGNNIAGATLTNVTVTGTGGHGADFTGTSTGVNGSNFTATGNGLDGLHIEGDGTYNFTGTTLLQGNGDDGLDITGHGTYTFATLNALDNNDAGITVKGTGVAGSITINGGQVSGNKALGDDGVGVFIDPITAHIVLDSITQTGGASGVVLENLSGSFTVNGATTISNTTGPAIAITDSPAAIRFGDINITDPGTDGMVFTGVNASVIAGNIIISGLGSGIGLDFSGSQTNFTAQSLNINGTGGTTSIGIDLVQTNGGTIIITNGGTIANVGTGVRLGIAGSPADTANAQFTFGGGSIGGNLASLDARGLNSGSGQYAFGTTTFNGPQLFDQTQLIFVAAGGTGDGTSLSDLASITDADNNTDGTAIFVLVNRGVIDDTDGFTLEAGQTLASFGNGRTFSLGGLPINVTGDNVDPGSTISDAAGAATLTASGSGDVVTLANNTSLQDFNISGGTANGIHGSGVTGVVLTGMTVSGAALNGVLFDGANDVSGSNLSSTGNGGAGLSIQGDGTYNFTGTTTVSDNAGDGLLINSNAITSFQTLNATSNGGSGVQATSTGTGSLSIDGGTVNNNTTSAFTASNIGLGVTLSNIGHVGGTTGVSLSGVSGSVSVTGPTTIGSTTGDGISISGSTATVGFSGDVLISQVLGNGIALNGNTGAVSFGYAEIGAPGLNGIDIGGNTGSVTFSGPTIVVIGSADGSAGINFSGTNNDVSFGTTTVLLGEGLNQTGIDFSGSSTTADFGLTSITGTGDLTSRGIDLSSTTGNKTITFLQGSRIDNVGVGVELSSGGTTATSANANFTFGDGNSADGLESFITAATGGYTVNTIGLDPALGNYDFDDVFFTGDAQLAVTVGGVVMISQTGGTVHAGTNGLSADVTTVTAAQADAMVGTQTYAFVGTVDLSATPFTLDSGQSITGFGNGNSILTSGTFQPVNVQGNLGATGGNVTGDEGVVKSTGDTLHLLGSNQVRNTAFDYSGGSGSVFVIDQSVGGFNNSGGTVVEGVTVSNVAAGQTAFNVDGLTGNLSIINNNINVAGTLLDVDGGNGNITVTRGNLPNSATPGTLTGGGIAIANRTGGLVNFTDKATIGGSGVSLTNNTGATITFADVDITTDAATAFTATGGGSVNVTTGTINATNAGAVALDGIAANINFASTSASFNSGSGVDLQHLTGTVALGTGTLTNTGSGTAFNVGSAADQSGGNAIISYAGTIASNGTGAAVSIQELTGGSVTLSGNLTDGNAADGGQIFIGGIANGTAATVTFSGSSKKISSGATTAVQIGYTGPLSAIVPYDNTDGTINFTNGGLDITTTTGEGFGAAFGGTVSVSGTGNKIASGGNGLFIVLADVGAAGVTFDSVSAVSTSDAAGVLLTGSNLAGDVNIGGLKDTGYMGASLNALLGAGAVNFTGTTDLDVSYRGFDIGGPQVGTINIANVAGSTLTIDGGEAGIVTNGLQAGIINVGGNGGVASIGATTSTTGAAIAVSGGNDLIHATLNYNGSIKVDTGMVVQAVADWSELNMSGSVVSTTAATGIGTAAFVFTGNANGVYNISSTIDHTGTGIGVRFDGSSNGTATFSGASKIFNTSSGTNDAIVKLPSISPTQGMGTLNFTNGGLVITTSSGAGFTASTFGAGTVSVSGTGNSITTTTGTALNLDNATVGAGGINFSSISVNGAATGVSLNNVSGGTLNLGTVNLQGITSTGVDISGTLGSTVNFASLTIAMPGDNSTGITFADAVVNSIFTTGGFTLTSASSTGTTAVNLSNTTGTGTIQLGDPNTAGASSTIGGAGAGPGIGFQFTPTTAINLIYGDGESAVDKLSTVKAIDILNSTGVFPVGGTYNFQDVDGANGGFIGDLSEAQGPTTYYVDQEGDGDGTAANPGSIAGAEASGASVVILVDTSQNGTSNLIDMMQAQQNGGGNNTLNLADGQILIGLKAGDSIDTAPLGAVGGGLGGNFSFSGINASTVITAASNVDSVLATLTTANGNTIDFSGKAGIENVIVQNTGAGLGISGTNITDLILRRATIAGGTGGALSLTDGAAASQIALSNLILSATGGDIAKVDGTIGAGLMKVSAFSDITLLGNNGETGGFGVSGVTFDAVPATVGIDQVDGDAFVAGTSTNGVGGYGLTLSGVSGDIQFDSITAYGGVNGIAFNGVDATVTVSGATTITGTSSFGIDVTGANTGTFTFGAVTVNNTATAGDGIHVVSGTVNVTGLANIDTTSGVGLSQSGGTTSFTGGVTIDTTTGTAIVGTGGTMGITASAAAQTVNSTSGQSISLTNVAATIALDSTSSGGGTNNVGLANVTGTVSLGSGALSGASGVAFLVNGGAATVSYGGSVTKTTAGKIVDISGVTGGSVTLSGALSATGGFDNGIYVHGNSGGTITLSGGTKTLTTGANTAVDLTTNTGATINFDTGGLVITTTSGTGFNASGGGTVSVGALLSDNIITTTAGGTALNLNGVTIGAAGMNFDSVSATAAATGISLTNIASSGGGAIILGTVNLQGITTRGVDVSGTLGAALSFNDLDIGLNSTTGVAFDLNGATINAAVTANDFDVTNAAAAGTSIGVDLRGTTGGQTVRLGDAVVGGASSSIAGVNTGVFLNSATNLAFTYGDGESATDQLSTIGANVGIDASSAPVAGTYNFQDVNFQSAPGLGFGVGKVYFVGASATGDGSGRDQNNLATLATAEAAAVATDILVLVNDGGTITAAGSNGNDTLALATGEQVRGFGNGNINLALTVPSTIQLASNSISIIDQTPNGAATLTTSAGNNVITLGASGNIIDGFILNGSPAGAARGVKDNGAGAANTVISNMTISNFATQGIEITPSNSTTINNVTFSGNASDVWLNASNTTITNVTSTGATGIAFKLDNTTGTTTLTNVNITTAATGTGIAFGGASGAGGTIAGTNVDISGGSGLSVTGGNAVISFDGASSIISTSGAAATISTRAGGSFTFAGSVIANGAASGISISGATAANTVSFTGTVDLGTTTPMTGTAVAINNGATASTVSFANLDIVTNGTTGFSAINGGTVNVTTGTVSSTSAQAVNLNGIATTTGINFTSTNSTGGTNNVSLTNVTGAGTVSLGSGALGGATGAAFLVTGGSANVSYAGSVTKTTAGNVVSISTRTAGTTTLSGTLSATGGVANGILVNANTGGTINFSGASKILTTGANNAVDLTANTNTAVNFTGGGLAITTTSGTGFNATSNGTGTVTVIGSGNTISTGSGVAVNLDSVAIAAGGVTFASTNKGAGGTSAVILDTVTGSGAIDLGTGALVGGTSAVIRIGDGLGTANSGGTAAFTYAGAITSGSTGQAVNIQDRALTAGNITLSGNITHNAAGQIGLLLDDNVAGIITFSGASKSITSTTAAGVSLSDNTGATINFTNGGLVIATTSGAGFNATGGGTVTVQGTGNTIASGTGTALNVANTTIGAGDVTFRSIASNGAANGIVLNNTGTSGNLVVTGTGATGGSGGTIQNSAGDGVSLTDTQDVSLSNMIISDNAGNGIKGLRVNGVVLNGLTLNSNADANTESGILFNELTGNASHVTTFTNLTVSNSFTHNVQVINSGGTLANLVVSGGTFSNNGASNNAGSDFIFEADGAGVAGAPTMTLTVDGATFTGNNAYPGPGVIPGTGLFVIANDGTVNAHIGETTGNLFNNLNNGINLTQSSNSGAGTGGNLNFTVRNNTVTNSDSTAINVFSSGDLARTLDGTIANNVIGTQGVATSGSRTGNGIRVGHESLGVAKVLIDNNIIQSIGVNGISGGDSVSITQLVQPGTVHAAVTNNTIRDNADSRGITVTATFAGAIINADVHANTITNVNNANAIRFLADGLGGADGTINVPQASEAGIETVNGGATALTDTRTFFNQPLPLLPAATP